MTTNGKVGPKVDENALKEFAKGKKTGEIQDYARNVNGVENVEVKLLAILGHERAWRY